MQFVVIKELDLRVISNPIFSHNIFQVISENKSHWRLRCIKLTKNYK
jgi:hypothetical protein